MDQTQQLLVEGNDDFHVIAALCKHFNINENFKIIDCQGIDKLLLGFPVRLKGSSTTKTIGVVIDADNSLYSRWNTIRQILINSGRYTGVPDKCPSDGLILAPSKPDDIKFGLWIMPDNNTSGMLEDFTTSLIPADDDLLPIVDATLCRLETSGHNRYSLIHHEKARIHTWLAWQETPGTPMGLAITKRYLTTETPICGLFVDWLQRLFN